MAQSVKTNKTIEKHTKQYYKNRSENETQTKTVVENHNWKLVDYTIVTTASVIIVLLILYVGKIVSKMFEQE